MEITIESVQVRLILCIRAAGHTVSAIVNADTLILDGVYTVYNGISIHPIDCR